MCLNFRVTSTKPAVELLPWKRIRLSICTLATFSLALKVNRWRPPWPVSMVSSDDSLDESSEEDMEIEFFDL